MVQPSEELTNVFPVFVPAGDQGSHQGLHRAPEGEPLQRPRPLLPQRDPQEKVNKKRSAGEILQLITSSPTRDLTSFFFILFFLT